MKFILKFILLCMAIILSLSFLLAAIVYLFFAMFRWLLTGQRPQGLIFLHKFKQWKNSPIWPQRNNGNTDIIDAETRDVTEINKKLSIRGTKDL